MNAPQDDRWAELLEQVRETRVHSRQLQARLRFLTVVQPAATSDILTGLAPGEATRLPPEPHE